MAGHLQRAVPGERVGGGQGDGQPRPGDRDTTTEQTVFGHSKKYMYACMFVCVYMHINIKSCSTRTCRCKYIMNHNSLSCKHQIGLDVHV